MQIYHVTVSVCALKRHHHPSLQMHTEWHAVIHVEQLLPRCGCCRYDSRQPQYYFPLLRVIHTNKLHFQPRQQQSESIPKLKIQPLHTPVGGGENSPPALACKPHPGPTLKITYETQCINSLTNSLSRPQPLLHMNQLKFCQCKPTAPALPNV